MKKCISAWIEGPKRTLTANALDCVRTVRLDCECKKGQTDRRTPDRRITLTAMDVASVENKKSETQRRTNPVRRAFAEIIPGAV